MLPDDGGFRQHERTHVDLQRGLRPAARTGAAAVAEFPLPLGEGEGEGFSALKKENIFSQYVLFSLTSSLTPALSQGEREQSRGAVDVRQTSVCRSSGNSTMDNYDKLKLIEQKSKAPSPLRSAGALQIERKKHHEN